MNELVNEYQSDVSRYTAKKNQNVNLHEYEGLWFGF